MKTLCALLALFISSISISQDYYEQFFDGADTLEYSSIFIDIDTNATNIWQIGPPQKTIFDSSFSLPNAIVTDTINYYPDSNTSSFSFDINDQLFGWGGIMAIQWVQKLDFQNENDGGVVEFTSDNGETWQNIFDNPYVYNLYGFDEDNVDTLYNDKIGFTRTDSLWKDVWLCFDTYWIDHMDTVTVRYTFHSDSISDPSSTGHEGWMIDNMINFVTIQHTIAEKQQEEYFEVFPSLTDGRVYLEGRKTDSYHIIEKLDVMDTNGQTVKSYEMVPTRFFIDLDDLPNGAYIIRIKTNLETVNKKIVLNKG